MSLQKISMTELFTLQTFSTSKLGRTVLEFSDTFPLAKFKLVS